MYVENRVFNEGGWSYDRITKENKFNLYDGTVLLERYDGHCVCSPYYFLPCELTQSHIIYSV